MEWLFGFICTWAGLLFASAWTTGSALYAAADAAGVIVLLAAKALPRWLTPKWRIGIAMAVFVVSVMVTVHDRISDTRTRTLATAEQRIDDSERGRVEADQRADAAARALVEAEQGVDVARQEQLNIIVFDATSPGTPWLFDQAVNQLKRVLGDCSIDARVYWENKFVRQRTVVYHQGERARESAEYIGELLPGNQEVAPLGESTLFGMHPDRDIVLMLGQDAGLVARRLATDDNTHPCPPLP